MKKERYKYFEFANGYKVIEDTETHIEYCSGNSIVKLLNKQNARIKELEEKKNKQFALYKKLAKENQQLKAQQNQKAIE